MTNPPASSFSNLFRAANDNFTSYRWKVRLVPLERSFPPPPGFENRTSMVWESVTPYVPPCHHLRRGDKERQEFAIEVYPEEKEET